MLREALGVDATLVKGSGGIFQVAVDGQVVAKKTYEGFPSDAGMVAAVGEAISSRR